MRSLHNFRQGHRIFSRALVRACIALLISVTSAAAQTKKTFSAVVPEARTAQAFDSAVRNGPLDLYAFLRSMPKGGDLHNHLSGAIYAETWIAQAAADHLCVNATTLTMTRSKGLTRSVPSQPVCADGEVAAQNALTDQKLYDAMIDAYSMRGFVASAGVTGHDHFFGAFGKFRAADSPANTGALLDAVAREAAAENTQYLELMVTPDKDHGAPLGAQLGWDANLEEFRTRLLASGIGAGVAEASKQLSDALAERKQREHCAQPDAAAACKVELRFLFQVLRGFPPQRVFAQMLLGFELASHDANVVGINIVMPEDGTISMRDYHLQMQMFDMLHRHYPKVRLSLHAGELAPGLVPPNGLQFHIREAIELGHAERIGHGVDVMYEDRPYDLLREMAQRHTMVEINLTSNDEILGVKGKQHPFPVYRRYGVPVALSSDDAGVSRIDLTHEYVRAVETYGLQYADLKQMVRTSLEHSFLPGASLWPSAARTTPESFTRMATACAHDSFHTAKPSQSCAAFLAGSEKATQQWELEQRFHNFESAY